MKYSRMKKLYGIPIVALICACYNCGKSYEEPVISLADYVIEDGFTLEVVASEPHLVAPVAIDFDNKGRIWVVEMPGYMNDMRGTDETKPVGRIQILEDLDEDGVVDHSKVFLDSLVMPRALAHVYGGLLYAEPPNLWFVEIDDDRPINKVLVDSVYAAEGNPEHQPNGLLTNIDNWIYNAKSNFRYRRKNGIWEKEPTTFRGQWGISKDDFGRLYYNDNSRQLLGDHVLPNRLTRNRHFTPTQGVAQMLTKDQRVYPLHATSVNRGYAKGVLNSDSILVNTTAACSPLIYRGGQFPKEYGGNAFVCIPEGNLLKRNILSFQGDSTLAKQAYEGREFLASTDEGFRPVNLNNGPDGSLFIVDMHRGMIGHHAYLSPYLRKKVEGNRLDTLTNFGRILKIKKRDAEPAPFVDFDTLENKELLTLLEHSNGWIRDRAQQLLIWREAKASGADLRQLVFNSERPTTSIHALYTLEGLNALDPDFLLKAARSNQVDVVAHSLVLMEQFVSDSLQGQVVELFEELVARDDPQTDVYLLSTLGKWFSFEERHTTDLVATILDRRDHGAIYREALLSGAEEKEAQLIASLDTFSEWDDPILMDEVARIKNQREKDRVNPIYSRKFLAEDTRTRGAKLYYEICASCHGLNGMGIEGLAPPLMNSEHVADPKRLGLIVLHGLEGPIVVNGKRYDLNLAMPGLIRNEEISDEDIAGIIAYVTNAFSDAPKLLKTEEVAKIRLAKPKGGAEYTEEELLDFSEK